VTFAETPAEAASSPRVVSDIWDCIKLEIIMKILSQVLLKIQHLIRYYFYPKIRIKGPSNLLVQIEDP
jgi:hypothetical protein